MGDRCQRRGDDQMDCQRRCESEESMSGRGRDVYHNRDFYGNRDYYRHRNFYGNHNVYGHRNFHGNNFYGHHNFFGQGNFHGNSMNGEEYCESEFMLRNEESCKASSCCQWNTWEEGEASFNGQGRCWSDIGTKMCTDMFEGHGSYSNSYGNLDFYGNRNFYGHRKFHGNNFYGHRNFYRNSMDGEEYSVQRKCYNEYWQNTDCSQDRSFHSIFKYDMSTCISGTEIYGDNDQWYYTPTSRCRDAACMDCEDFTSMPSRKYQCMPCSFRDNCSFMRVDCEYDDEYDGSRFGKTDSYYHGFGRNCGKYQYWNGYKCVSRRSNMYHEFFKAEESVGSSSSRYSCMERCQRDGYDYMACEMKCPSEESVSDRDSSSSDSKSSDNYQPSRRSSRKNCGRDQYWDGYRCVSRSGKEEVAYHSQTYSKHHGY